MDMKEAKRRLHPNPYECSVCGRITRDIHWGLCLDCYEEDLENMEKEVVK